MLLEQRYKNNEIDLYYGDEMQVSEEAYVPYGWQFKDENISVKSAKGKKLNCFGKTPMQTLIDAIPLVKEKMISEHFLYDKN